MFYNVARRIWRADPWNLHGSIDPELVKKLYLLNQFPGAGSFSALLLGSDLVRFQPSEQPARKRVQGTP